MRVEEHIERALNDVDRADMKSALMHACVGIEATARNLFSVRSATNRHYKDCLRQYWWLLEAFGCPGINLEETKWTHLALQDGNGKQIFEPDLADIIYHVFRCNDAHANAIPVKYDLLPRYGDNYVLGLSRVDKSLQLPQSIIFALIAVTVFSHANSAINTSGPHFLTWTDPGREMHRFDIKDWWGRESDVKAIIDRNPPIRVKIEGL